MDRAGTDDLLASPLAKRNMLLAVIPASSLLEMCFFTAPIFGFGRAGGTAEHCTAVQELGYGGLCPHPGAVKKRKQSIAGESFFGLQRTVPPQYFQKSCMDRAGTDDLLASPLAKRNMLLAVIPASSLLEMCFFTAPLPATPSGLR